jgi:hypothetical protein
MHRFVEQEGFAHRNGVLLFVFYIVKMFIEKRKPFYVLLMMVSMISAH